MSDLHNASDDFDDDGPIYEDAGRRRLTPLARTLAITAIGIAGIAFAGLVWFAYNEGVRSGAEETAPVLRADTAPIKRKPEDAGGMEIPHQDKLVYDRIAPGQAQQPVERLLPPPEVPVDRPAMPAEQANAAPADVRQGDGAAAVPPKDAIAGAIEQAVDEADKPSDASAGEGRPFVREPDAAEKSAESAPAPPPTPSAEAPAAPPPAPEPQQAAVPPPAPKPAPAPAASGPAWRVQLASLSNEAGARKEMQRLQKANTDLLGDLDLKLQPATLSKGTFYRIQAGPLADRATALALCGKLKTRKQDCLVVSP
jgi:cell division septation protein DedD